MTACVRWEMMVGSGTTSSRIRRLELDKAVLSKREDGRGGLADVKWERIASWTGGAALVLGVTFVIALVVYLTVTLTDLPVFLDAILVGTGVLLWIAGVADIIDGEIKEAKKERTQRGY